METELAAGPGKTAELLLNRMREVQAEEPDDGRRNPGKDFISDKVVPCGGVFGAGGHEMKD